MVEDEKHAQRSGMGTGPKMTLAEKTVDDVFLTKFGLRSNRQRLGQKFWLENESYLDK